MAGINALTSPNINDGYGQTIKNLKKAAERILRAIKNNEKIVLYGDADLDGVASLIILEETIKNLGGKITAIYFPDREIEGYGISEKGINYLVKKIKEKNNNLNALLISLDCGIGNFKEVNLAKKQGFEVIIIDHHEVLDKLPRAEIIIDPKQKNDKYPFKGLATAGIVFKLAETLLGKKMTGSLKRNFLELVALATLADMMPRESENQIFIEEGLNSLANSWRPGIRVFFEMQESPFQKDLGINQKVSKIISILNIREIENGLPAHYRLLTSCSIDESREIVKKLLAKSIQRKEKIEKIIQEIEKIISDSPIIFEGSPEWEFTLISPVASNLCQKYKKPTFIFKKLEKESQGTVRTPNNIDGVNLMKKCKKYLITYGGHPQAAGFRIKNENLENFKSCLIKHL